jgi:hypothetical protein
MSNNVTNSIPATLNDLLVKLKILSMVERGKKINMWSMTFVDSNSWFGSFNRSMYGEGRKSLMIHLNQIIQQAINAINEYQNTEFCKIIVNHLAEAKVGIQTLTTTYQSDPSIVAQLEVCMSNIDLQLEKNRHFLIGHYSNKQTASSTPIQIYNQPAFGSKGTTRNSISPGTPATFTPSPPTRTITIPNSLPRNIFINQNTTPETTIQSSQPTICSSQQQVQTPEMITPDSFLNNST